MKKTLMYRVVPHNGGVVFAERKRALLIARIHAAINSSKTWAEFRSLMPRDAYSDVIRASFDDNDEPRPRSTDEFSGEYVSGWSDGDYPPWLQLEMGRLLPASVLERFGTLESTHLNGSYWSIPEKNLEAICEVLATMGWNLEFAPELPFH